MIGKRGITRKLDVIVSQIVRSRGYCVRCKEKKNLQAAHIFSRSNRSVRWALNNILCLCAGCHFWSHQNPILFTEWVREWLGEFEYEKLKKDALKIKQWTLEELKELYARFKEIKPN